MLKLFLFKDFYVLGTKFGIGFKVLQANKTKLSKLNINDENMIHMFTGKGQLKFIIHG